MAFPPLHPDSAAQGTTFRSEEFGRAFPGESQYVEFKTGVGNDRLQEAIVAFSNAGGGVVLVGVRDDGSVAGRALDARTHDAIIEALRSVHDPGSYTIREVLVDGEPIVALSVARRIEGFAQTSQGRVLARRGTLKLALFGTELRQLLIERSLQRYDEHSAGIALDSASDRCLHAIAAVFGWTADAGIAERLAEQGLVLPDHRGLTIAGAAFLLDDPGVILGKSYVEVLRFPSGSDDYDRRVEIRGPLQHQVERTVDLLEDELGIDVVVLGVQRHELPRIPRVVLREAVANAVAHRSYEVHGTTIRIEVRPHELTITSPGGLPEPVTEQNIDQAQAARNPRVINVLRRANLAEDAGRGIRVMVDGMRSELLDPPQFRDLGHAVRVVLPIRSVVAANERAWVREVEARGEIAGADRLVLVHAARGEVLTNGRVRQVLACDSQEARASLQRLRDAGLLRQRGQRGAATYVLAETLSAPAGLRLSDEQMDEMLLSLAADAPLSNARVRQATRLDRADALRQLERLVRAGHLRRVGERRGTRYELINAGD